MTSFVWQIVGMVLLFGTVWLGNFLWRHRLGHRPSRVEALAAFVLLGTLAGGFWGAFAWWQNLPYAFSWPLPGLAARMLAAAGWSFALASALALWRPYPTHLRLVLLMLWVYLAPLTAAILTQHLDRFDFTREVTVAFFIIVVLLLVTSSFSLLALPRQDLGTEEPPNSLSSWALGLIGAVAGLWAVTLFLKPDGPWPLIWPWPGDALTTRLIASMFLTIAVGAIAARPDQQLGRTVFWTTITYGVGVVIAGVAHVMTAEPSPMGYSDVTWPKSYMTVWGVLGAIAAVALVGSWRSGVGNPRQRSRDV
ncbi:hypothetical protein MWU53_00230 [Aliiroseovarius sp. S1123]|uniref:hypothetical protein n=1 Tax=unclassified Aliiroseovarius TaxID=2623558 RepID=UPI001FF33E1E|nr:hypothetical protein [Aliiroseovarius sp. S1123]MCK0169477.1 hypothetical protein [Aliiroseovarius sp. S1123]